MRRYTLRPAARRDLQEIHAYIARENPLAALDMVLSIQQKLVFLAEYPYAGRAYREVRTYPVGSYRILYQPTRTGIRVLRVVHGRRDHD
jgi:toxin ParE1/3/4